MKPAALAALAAALLVCACSSAPDKSARIEAEPPPPVPSKSEAVVVASATFALGKAPGQGEINRFYAALETAQKTVIEKAGGPGRMPEGFSYAVTPAGAVSPFSSVEVDCLLSQAEAAGPGAKYCRQFIEQILIRYGLKKP